MNYDPELDFPIDINNIVDALDALNWNNIRGLSEENFAELHMISYDIRSWKLSLHRKDRIKLVLANTVGKMPRASMVINEGHTAYRQC